MGGKMGDLPITEAKNKVVLSLPMFPELTQDEQIQIANTIQKALNVYKVNV